MSVASMLGGELLQLSACETVRYTGRVHAEWRVTSVASTLRGELRVLVSTKGCVKLSKYWVPGN
jgi:hypothetical protein